MVSVDRFCGHLSSVGLFLMKGEIHMKKTNVPQPDPEQALGLENAEEFLRSAIKHGILSVSDVRNTIAMKKKKSVLRVHPYKISQGRGSDKRFFTYITEGNSSQRKKVRKNTEIELIDYLYEYYFGEDLFHKNCTIPDIYEEWLNYRLATCRSESTVHRNDNDYKRFYVNEPLSKHIMSTPIRKLTRADIREWMHLIIKKYEMDATAFGNMAVIIRQIFKYMMDRDMLETDNCNAVHIDKRAFVKKGKPKAETQIFYEDEVEEIISLACQKAQEKSDESFYAIPLFFYTGLRIGECLGLSHDDFDKETRTLHVHRSFVVMDHRNEDGSWAQRKYEVVDYLKQNGNPRDVLITKECFDLQRETRKMQFKKGIDANGLLFRVKTPNNISCKLARICKELGIDKRSPHKGRKTYISTLLNKGLDPDFVRTQVGHRDLQTTLNSYAFSTTRKEKQLDALSEALSY